MANGKYPHIPHEELEQPQLEIPDLSVDFSADDFLKELSLAIPDLMDLVEEETPAPELADPASLDLDIEPAEVPKKAPPPKIHIEDAPAKRKPDPDFPLISSDPVEEAEEEESAPKAPKAKLSKGKKILILSGAIFLVLVLAVGGFFTVRYVNDPYDHKILDNVTVAGVQIGGMTRKEAEAALHAATDNTFSQQDMVVSLPHGTITLPAADTEAQLNVRSAVKAAYNYGRKGSKAEREAAYNASAQQEYALDVSSYLKLDVDFIREQLSAYASKYDTVQTQYSHHLEGKMPALEEETYDGTAPCQTLEITLGTPSLGLDMEDIYNSILTTYAANQFQVTVEDIDPAAKPDPVDLNALMEKYAIEPVDASLDMEKFCPIPGDYGYSFNLENAQKIVDAAGYGETVSIPMEYVEPEILQNEVYFRDVLGECKTPHTDNENRNENLRLACASLNDKILQPGEELSYNETLGQRTKENGYKAAPAYSGTALVDSLGGGICQVSSTLYYCALLSDLEIVSRINHGFPVGYIELGMDATVSWGSPDFVFKNNSNFPIKIHAWVEDGHVNMQILGTIEKDYYVKMEYEQVGGENPAVTYQTHGPDSGYYDGQVLNPGAFGPYVKSYRCKYDRETDELISRDFETRSHYMSSPKVVVQIVE